MANLYIKTPSSASFVLIFQLLVLRPRPSGQYNGHFLLLPYKPICNLCLLHGFLGNLDLDEFMGKFSLSLQQTVYKQKKQSRHFPVKCDSCWAAWALISTALVMFWGQIRDAKNSTHLLLHFVKSACFYSVNPFSALFSANIQHDCQILFCICP